MSNPTLKPEKPALIESRPLILVAGAGFDNSLRETICLLTIPEHVRQLRLKADAS